MVEWDTSNALHYLCSSFVMDKEKKWMRIVLAKPHDGVVIQLSPKQLTQLRKWLEGGE